jgi:hypothetical protein
MNLGFGDAGAFEEHGQVVVVVDGAHYGDPNGSIRRTPYALRSATAVLRTAKALADSVWLLGLAAWTLIAPGLLSWPNRRGWSGAAALPTSAASSDVPVAIRPGRRWA